MLTRVVESQQAAHERANNTSTGLREKEQQQRDQAVKQKKHQKSVPLIVKGCKSAATMKLFASGRYAVTCVQVPGLRTQERMFAVSERSST